MRAALVCLMEYMCVVAAVVPQPTVNKGCPAATSSRKSSLIAYLKASVPGVHDARSWKLILSTRPSSAMHARSRSTSQNILQLCANSTCKDKRKEPVTDATRASFQSAHCATTVQTRPSHPITWNQMGHGIVENIGIRHAANVVSHLDLQGYVKANTSSKIGFVPAVCNLRMPTSLLPTLLRVLH